MVGAMTDGRPWPIYKFRPWDHGCTLLVMSFPAKTVNCGKVAVRVMSLVCHEWFPTISVGIKIPVLRFTDSLRADVDLGVLLILVEFT